LKDGLTTRTVEVAGFFLLQIGLPVIKFNGWTLFSDAVFQSLSVRASGFNILPIANFAPSLLYVSSNFSELNSCADSYMSYVFSAATGIKY